MRCIRALALYSLVTALSFPIPAAEQQLPGRVLHVADGDSLVLDVRGSHYRIDLAGVDAPEANQPWGPTAAARLGRLLTGAFVVVERLREDGTGGLSGEINFKGRDVAHDLLYDGLAWSTVPVDTAGAAAHPGTTDLPAHPYTVAEADARQARRGLWSDAEPVPPWVWRRLRGGHDGADTPRPQRPDPRPSSMLHK